MTEKHYQVFKGDIVDNITSTDTDKPLSANQGRVLDENKLDKSRLTTGTAVPTTAGSIGDLYVRVFYDVPDGYVAIASPDDLVAFAKRICEGELSLNACLVNDIDMAGISYPMTLAWPNRYKGTFDGYGHTISNLNGILIGYVNGSLVKRVGFINCTSSKSSIIYNGDGSSSCSDCYVRGSTINGSYTGAITSAVGTTITNCYAYNCISNGNVNANALVGDSPYNTAKNCAAYGGNHGDRIGCGGTNNYTSADVSSEIFHTQGFWDGTGVSGTTYLSWDFTNTWEWDAENDLPKLKPVVVNLATELYAYNGSAWVKIGSSEEA